MNKSMEIHSLKVTASALDKAIDLMLQASAELAKAPNLKCKGYSVALEALVDDLSDDYYEVTLTLGFDERRLQGYTERLTGYAAMTTMEEDMRDD